MKKLWSSSRWRRQTIRTQKAVKKQRARRRQKVRGAMPNLHRAQQNARAAARRRVAEWKQIEAPAVFSILHNTADVLNFFARVEDAHRRGNNVFLDSSRITSVTPETIPLLISRVRDDRFTYQMGTAGNVPADEALRKIFVDSGLRQHIRARNPDLWPSQSGFVLSERTWSADPAKADEMRTFGEKFLNDTDLPWKGVQRILMECMQNTMEHAAADPGGHEPGWASVFCDQSDETAKFTFLDNGVGIFNSVKLTRLREAMRGIGVIRNVDLMPRILAGGQIPSSTGLAYRGEGLPAMRSAVQDYHTVDRLIIVTNDVFADVGAARYETIEPEFQGTLIYWEKRGRWRKQ